MELPIEKIDRMGFILLKVAALLLLLSCLFSCRTPQQISKKHLDKALSKDRAFVLDTLRKVSPCVVVKKDTVTNTEYKTNTDTLTTERTVTVLCPDSAGVKVIRTVKYNDVTYLRTDSIFIIHNINTRIRDMADSLYAVEVFKKKDAEIKKQSGRREWWFHFSIISTILLLLSVIVNVLQSKRKIITNNLKAV